MKKFITLTLLIIVLSRSFAIVIPVTVTNFMFSPNTINATVGDVIQFNWSAGSHTTTCGPALAGTSLPAGAAAWNNPMNSANTTFSYTLTVAGTYFYGCIPHFGGGAGMSATINVSNVAPVTFGNFSAVPAGKNALLSWTTLTEQNTDHFTVKKSTDGIHFNKVSEQPAAGNSSGQRTYAYTDDISGDNFKYLYYEIITTDLDGKESFSPIRMLRSNNVVSDNFIVQLGPNPIVRPNMMKILFNADGHGTMDMKIFSQNGKLVLHDQTEYFYGLNNAHLHVCDLPGGEYVAVFTLNGKKESRKIMVK